MLAQCLAGALAALVAAGCATSGPRSRYLERIAPESFSNLAAYRTGNTLEIIYPLGGKDAFAHATWNAPAAGGFTSKPRRALPMPLPAASTSGATVLWR